MPQRQRTATQTNLSSRLIKYPSRILTLPSHPASTPQLDMRIVQKVLVCRFRKARLVTPHLVRHQGHRLVQKILGSTICLCLLADPVIGSFCIKPFIPGFHVGL